METDDKKLRADAYAEICNAIRSIGLAKKLVIGHIKKLMKDSENAEIPGLMSGTSFDFVYIDGAITTAYATLNGLRAQFEAHLLEEDEPDDKEAD